MGVILTVGSVGSVPLTGHVPGFTSTSPRATATVSGAGVGLGLGTGLSLATASAELVRVTSRVFKPSTVTWALFASGALSATPSPEKAGSPNLNPATEGTFSVSVTTTPSGTLLRGSMVPSPFSDNSPLRVSPLYW